MLVESRASVDKELYDKAKEFYRMMVLLIRDESFLLKTNTGILVFKGSFIGHEYSNLVVLFVFGEFDGANVSGNKASYRYSEHKPTGKKLIIVSDLIEGIPVVKQLSKVSFIHEVIHHLDFSRMKSNYKPNITDKTTHSEYYNLPTELNAYYMEVIGDIMNKIKKDRDYRDRIRLYYNTFPKFNKWIFDVVLNYDFVDHLTPANRKRITKRLYDLYTEYIQPELKSSDDY